MLGAHLHEFDMGSRGFLLEALAIGFGRTSGGGLRSCRRLACAFQGSHVSFVLTHGRALPLLREARLMLHFRKESAPTRHANLYLLP
ncbi:hypothetical protein AWH51_02460 [Clavibacter tessellarius]|uniref:Uncharacterized protein n=1 Tax=Clavibacter tessellarius TaxID=31965 RepID=A0A154V5C7_9MICO|nr:hypothetical protein AWH51_02460 [Clavibacter michiganensis subsp. tessellarius]